MKKTLILLFVAIFSLVSVTYSWILSGNPLVRSVSIDYQGIGDKGKLTIAPKELEMEIYIPNDDGIYDKCDDVIYLHNMIPNKVFTFKLRLKNHSRSEMNIKITLENVSFNVINSVDDLNDALSKPIKKSLLDVLSFGCSAGSGYYDDININVPESQFCNFSDDYRIGFDDDKVIFNIELSSGISVPVTKGNDYVELLCYFKMSELANNDYQNQSIMIENFVASSL